MRKLAFPFVVLLLCSLGVSANVPPAADITTLGLAVTQDFNSLPSAGSSTSTPAGWTFSESGSSGNNNGQIAANNGGANAGDTYSYGNSSDRGFGQLRSGTLVSILGAQFRNNTGSTITSLAIQYAGEQWRLGAINRTINERMDFQYSLDASSLTTGTYIDVNPLDFTPATTGSVGVALDGNLNAITISSTINGLNIPAGASFFIRWIDVDATGSDDGLAIDDFSIIAQGGPPQPTLSVNDVSIAEGNSGTTVATFTVTATGANPSGITFDIATADGTGGNKAEAGAGDYLSHAVNAVTIPPGVFTYSFPVTINGDATFEQDEVFSVNLSNATNALITDGQGVGTIINDDPVVSDVVISQVYGGGGNQGSIYTHDFIELFNRGTSTVSLAGWSVQYQSAAGTGAWQVTPLSGSMPPGTYYLIQEASGGSNGTTPLPSPDVVTVSPNAIAMAAGAGKVALLNTQTPANGNCPVFNNQLDLVGYGGAATCFEGTAPTGAPNASTAELRKRGGCFDTNKNNVDFTTGDPLPRNSASPVRTCTFQTAAIHQIQGDGGVTPFLGLDVQTNGIVTALKSNGFFMQTVADEDSNPQTSEGIFVFTGATPAVAPGDAVTARGTATEYFNLTQLESSLPGDVIVDSTGNAVPSALTLTTSILDANGPFDQLERFEGMRVYAASLVTVSPSNEFGEVLAVLNGVPRPMREPGIEASLPVPPDPTDHVVDCCIPIWDENPERIMVDTDGLVGSTRLTLTSNVLLTDVAGPLDFTFGDYKILPDLTPLASQNMDAVAVPMPLAEELTVGGYNIENFANNPTQRQKASLAIRDVMRLPDVIGHIEIANLASLEALAAQVNGDAALIGQTPNYVARLIPAPQGGTQHVGFLIKTSRVQIDGVTQELANQTFLDPVNGDTENLHDRPPLVLRAKALLPGQGPRPFFVVVNHLRSFIDVELVAGEGIRVRNKRKKQAEAVAQLLQDLQTQNPGVPVISVGDYNAYQFNDGYTDPISVLKGTPTADDEMVEDASDDVVNPNYINLVDSLPADQQYSFIFEGTPQALDHVLLNTVAASLNTRFAIARNNADFPEGPLFANDATRPERNSDHDMPVAYFRFPVTADLTVAAAGGGGTVVTGTSTSYSFTVENEGPDPASNVVVTIPFGGGLQFSDVSVPAGWSCAVAAGGATCSIASLAPGASASIALTSIVGCDVSNGAVVGQSISVGADEFDGDGSNNTASVSVTASNPAPTISGVISPIVVFPMAGTNPPGAIVTDAQLGSPAVFDNCSATLVRTGVPAGNNFPIGTTTVTYTATDSGGATASATQVVTVLSATDSLEAIAAELREIVAAAGQQGPLKARAADALKKVELAIAQLAATPPDTQHALISISQASQQIEGLMNQGALPAAIANSLLQRLAGVSASLN